MGYTVYGKEKVEVDVQIANYIASKEGQEKFIVVGTDYDFMGLMNGQIRLLSPTRSNSWYLDVDKFRKVICDKFGATFKPLDIFVAYNLATNDNMKTHIKGVGFSKALIKLAQWIPVSRHDRNKIAHYSPFIKSLCDNRKECDAIVR